MIGIDVSKETLTVTWLDPRTRLPRWEANVPNTPDGVDQILARTPAGMALVVEPTGSYSQLVAARAHAAQRPVLLAQPKRAKAFLASVQPRAKTDRVDSRGLALYGLCADLRPYPLKSAPSSELDQQLQIRASLTQTLMRLRQQRRAFPSQARLLDPTIRTIEESIAQIDAELEHPSTPTETHQQAAELDRIPGVGPITALTVASRLCERRFATPAAFVAFAGLDVKVRESGRFHGKRKLTKQGDPELRRLLYLAAQASLRCKTNPFAQQFEREYAKGMTKTGATCAVARKLAKVCWSLVTHGSHYTSERLYDQKTIQQSACHAAERHDRTRNRNHGHLDS